MGCGPRSAAAPQPSCPPGPWGLPPVPQEAASSAQSPPPPMPPPPERDSPLPSRPSQPSSRFVFLPRALQCAASCAQPRCPARTLVTCRGHRIVGGARAAADMHGAGRCPAGVWGTFRGPPRRLLGQRPSAMLVCVAPVSMRASARVQGPLLFPLGRQRWALMSWCCFH